MTDHTRDELLNSRRPRLARPQLPEFRAQAPALQGLAAVRVRWPAVRAIPRRLAPITDHLLGLAPRPQLDQHVHPRVDVEGPDVGPDVPHLLLSQSLHLLQVVEVMLDAEAVRRSPQDLRSGQGHIGADNG